MKQKTSLQVHLVSGGIAAGYALALHLVYIAIFPIVYLIQGGAFGAMTVWHLAMLPLGVVATFLVRRLTARWVTFSVALLVAHVALSILFFLLVEPVFEPMIAALQNRVGLVLTGQPEENFDGLYLLISEILMQVFFGLFFFIAMLASIVLGDRSRET